MPGRFGVTSALSAPQANCHGRAGPRRADEHEDRWPAATAVPFAATLALGLWAAIIAVVRLLL